MAAPLLDAIPLHEPARAGRRHLGDHGSPEGAAAWFTAVRRDVGGQSIAHEAGEAAFDAAREVLTRTGRAETDVGNQQHERLALLVGGRSTAARPPA
jgi:hypothetical protein